MRVRAAIDGVDVSDSVAVESLSIRQDSSEAISTAELSMSLDSGVAARYDQARYDADRYASAAASVEEWQQVSIWDEDTTQLLFAGFALSVQRKPDGKRVRNVVSASDWGILFERAVITQSWPAGTADSTIITDILAHVPEITAGTIVTQMTLGEIEFKDQRIRDAIDEICALTGAEWNVSYDGKLNYYRIGSIVAPFGLSDQPDGTTKMPYRLDDYARDFSEAANRVLVLGALTDTGEIRSTANNASSQTQYGILSVTLVDRNISSQLTADVWAQTEVAERAFPKPTVMASLTAPGLARGMSVDVEAKKYGLDGTLVLRTLEISIAAPDHSRTPAGHVLMYKATLGARIPDSVYMLRRLQRRPVERTSAPSAPIAPGSITDDSFASGIAPVYIVSAKPIGAEWDQYPADAVFLNTADNKLYRRIAGNDWTAVVNAAEIEGQLQTTQLAPGSVTETVLADGSVVTAKIPAGAIQAPQIDVGAVTGPAIAASAVTAGKIAANAVEAGNIAANAVTTTALAAGSVTANAIAANAVYAEAMQANSVTAIALAANSVVAGKIAALAVVAGNLAADSVVAGTIAAAAINARELAADCVIAAKIKAGEIDSSKLVTTFIDVGGGGSKPGRIYVRNAAGTIVAEIGTLSTGDYGGWFKQIGAGGTGYSDAKVRTDAAGSLFIRDADTEIINSSTATRLRTSPTTFDGTYSSIMLIAEQTSGAGDKAEFISRGLVVLYGGSTVGAFVRHPSQTSAAQCILYGPGKQILLDGYTGICRADGGFQFIGNPGQTVTIGYTKPGGATGSLQFQGGILTSYT